MGLGTLVAYDFTDDNTTYKLDGGDVQSVAMAVQTFFSHRKYKLEEGTLSDGVYGTGNKVLRVLLGAFVKRYKFSVQVFLNDQTGDLHLVFGKAMSGAMGGVIGYRKMTKEYGRLAEDMKTIFG